MDYIKLINGSPVPYRKALRDIPQQAGFPDNITWPQEPTA